MDTVINVIVIGDAFIIGSLAESLNIYNELKVVGAVASINDAKNIISKYGEAIVVYAVNNIEYEALDEFLKYLNGRNIKSLFICRNAAEGFLMLEKGATEMIVKTDLENKANSRFVYSAALMKIKSIYELADARTLKKNFARPVTKIIGIGSSTGGTETVRRIILALPDDAPPVLVVQHMPPVFTRLFAERLHDVCRMSVWEAKDGDELRPGLVLIAPGDYHMRIEKRGSAFFANCAKGEKVNGHCPSVDIMFESMAKTAGRDAIGVILTGMGNDGANGLLEMRKKGAYTIGQDKDSSVVYGMPKAAYDIGAVTRQAADADIARIIMENI